MSLTTVDVNNKKLFGLGVNNWENGILQQLPMHPHGRIHKQHGCMCEVFTFLKNHQTQNKQTSSHDYLQPTTYQQMGLLHMAWARAECDRGTPL